MHFSALIACWRFCQVSYTKILQFFYANSAVNFGEFCGKICKFCYQILHFRRKMCHFVKMFKVLLTFHFYFWYKTWGKNHQNAKIAQYCQILQENQPKRQILQGFEKRWILQKTFCVPQMQNTAGCDLTPWVSAALVMQGWVNVRYMGCSPYVHHPPIRRHLSKAQNKVPVML